MQKIAIVYWSGTGNTEEIAKAAALGVEKAGGDASLFHVNQFSSDDMKNYDGFLFGCPAMGDEKLEEAEFEPFFTSIETKLKQIPIGLFGSYGWGGGTWMQNWQKRVQADGAKLIAAGLAIENGHSDAGIKACEALGQKIASSLA